MAAVDDIVHLLEERKIAHEVIRHREAFSAGDAARAAGVPAERLAKTLLVETGGGEVLAVLPATERLDVHKLRLATGDNHARLASEEEMAAAHGEFELGALPPLPDLLQLPVLLDRRLETVPEVVFAAGSRGISVRVSGADFLELTRPRLVDLAQDEEDKEFL